MVVDEIERGDVTLTLDFQGNDDMVTLPIEQAYAVEVRERPECGLYLGKRATAARPNRAWDDDLAHFVRQLDGVSR